MLELPGLQELEGLSGLAGLSRWAGLVKKNFKKGNKFSFILLKLSPTFKTESKKMQNLSF